MSYPAASSPETSARTMTDLMLPGVSAPTLCRNLDEATALFSRRAWWRMPVSQYESPTFADSLGSLTAQQLHLQVEAYAKKSRVQVSSPSALNKSYSRFPLHILGPPMKFWSGLVTLLALTPPWAPAPGECPQRCWHMPHGLWLCFFRFEGLQL